jgi:hypothetical protein
MEFFCKIIEYINTCVQTQMCIVATFSVELGVMKFVNSMHCLPVDIMA